MRSRVLIAVLLIFAIGIGATVYRMVQDIDPRYRESAEESLVETSHLLAALVEQDMDEDGTVDTPRLAALMRAVYARPFEAQIFSLHKTRVELRVYVTDDRGYVVYDSTGRGLDQDYSEWRDVRQTLRGQYGARTTRDVESDANTAVMYVGAPILLNGRIVGVVSVGKPVQSFGQFASAARENALRVGLISAAAVVGLALIASLWLVRPFGFVTDYGRWAWRQRTFNPLRHLRRIADQLRGVGAELRDAMAGRNYVTDYVQTLTHEVKSPLSAIRGAAELLQEPEASGMSAAQREKFLGNILRETQRIQETVDRMMELTALESQRTLTRVEPVALGALVQDVAESARPAAAQRGIAVTVRIEGHGSTEGDPFLLRRAVANLVDNAIDFSDSGAEVCITLEADGRRARIKVRDHGPGIPAYAEGKVFEKFYSLARPASRKKSTGLGLAFVREIAALHHGRIELANAPDGPGALATLTLPREPNRNL